MIHNTNELLQIIKNTPTLTDSEIALLVRITTKTILITEAFETRAALIEAIEEFIKRYENNPETEIFIGLDISVKND